MSNVLPIRVKSKDPFRILRHVTPRTKSGAGRLTVNKRWPGQVTPELVLLMGLLHEEFESSFVASDARVSMLCRHVTMPPPKLVPQPPSSITDVDGTVMVIKPLQRLAIEFDMSVGEVKKSDGRVQDHVVFRYMTFYSEESSDDTTSQATPDDSLRGEAEESGVWRVSPRHKGYGAAPSILQVG